MNLGEMSRNYDPSTLKREVNLVAVVLDAGVDLDPVDESRLTGHCPFHSDEVASFAVWKWEDGDTWACGCFACSPFRDGTASVGDVFDFLQAFYHVSFRQSVELAVGFLNKEMPELPDMPKPRGPAPDLGHMLAEASGSHGELLHELLHARGVDVPADWVRKNWRVADGGHEVLIPHFDELGEITALKHRNPDDGWTSRSVRGSELTHLYGEWRARGGTNRPLFLCEGESDTWTVSYIFDGEPVDVLGLPSGAAANPKHEWLDLVAGRDLVLLLDADRAGREAAGKWSVLASGAGARVRVANLPDGTDCTSAGADEVRRAVEEAWPWVDPGSLALYIEDDRYWRHTKDSGVVLSDFVMRPTRLIDLDGAIVYEVEVPGRQGVQLVTDAELASTDRLRRWCAARALSWKGTNRDVSDLLELLKSQSILVPRVRGTDVVGLHGDVFVMPNESIGSTGYAYVPPENDINLSASINLGGPGWDAELPLMLSELHRADVVTPILGWVAAAPLRSLVAKFPVLGVTGGSGYGKTTILEVILSAFGFWTVQPTTLTGATPHGLQSYVGSTNCIPIWIDEYRPGARIEAKFALDQIIRDSWDGSATIKGGLHENRMKIQKLPARAPLVVTGEDTFSETSHSERMLMIDLPKVGRNGEVLTDIRSLRSPAFGRAYLQWLLSMIRRGTLPEPPNIPDRKSQARAVGYWGYQLFDRFCQELCGYELPKYDDALAVQAHADIERTPVIVEALIEAIDHTYGDNQVVVIREEDDLIVKIQPFCARAVKMGFVLPGGSKAVDKWLRDNYGAFKQMDPIYNRVTVVPGIMAGRDEEDSE